MMKKYLFMLFFIIFLAGCQSVSDGPVGKISDFTIEQEITQIDVLDWQTDESIYQITDTDFIQTLISELSSADSRSTANMDFANPDYKLVFISDVEVVYELGYYRNNMNLGIVGRYWDSQKDGLYGVTLKLPGDE